MNNRDLYLCCFTCKHFIDVYETDNCEPGWDIDCEYNGQYNTIEPCSNFELDIKNFKPRHRGNKYDQNI